MKPSKDISRLLEIMAALRTPETGCPWDLEQDFGSIAPYTLATAHEGGWIWDIGLIDRLERHRRGIFMGATGYLSAHGRIDLGIAIRTIVCREGKAYFEVGAGIVWDSDAAAEYEETLAKGRALFAALGAQPASPS